MKYDPIDKPGIDNDPSVLRAREAVRIRDLVQQFAVEMERRLLDKLTEKSGWNNEEWTPEDVVEEIKHRAIVGGNPIDIANYAAFWWSKL